MKRVISAILSGLLLSCQGPAAALAQEAVTAAPAASGASALASRTRALDTLDRRLAHYVMSDRTSAIRARLAERRAAYLAVTDPEGFRHAINADLLAVSADKHLQVWVEARSRDDVIAEGPPPTMEAMSVEEARQGYGVRAARMLDGGIGYLDLAWFSGHPDSASAVDAAMETLAGARALIIDLRDNGGGGEVALKRLMGHLAPEPIVLEEIHTRRCAADPSDPEGCIQDGSRDVEVRRADAILHPHFPTQPIYVLTSARSFSAAEAVAYDLQATRRATVVGEVTGGGANPSIAMDLGPWFTIIMPIAVSRHPVTGTNWEGVGVRPDIEVPAEAALETARQLAGG